MSVEEGIELSIEALKSSTQIDTASGNGMDVFVITEKGVKHAVAQEIAPDYRSR